MSTTYFVRHEPVTRNGHTRYGTHFDTEVPEHAEAFAKFYGRDVISVTVCNDIWTCTHSHVAPTKNGA